MPITGSPGSMTAQMVLPSIGENPGTRKALVLLHGAGSFVASDYQPVVDHVQNVLGNPITCIGVLYSDVLNPPLSFASATAGSESPEVAKMQADLENELARDAFTRAVGAVPSDQLLRALTAGVFPGGLNFISALVNLFRSPPNAFTSSLVTQLQRAFPGVPFAAWMNNVTASGALGSGSIDIKTVIRQVSQYLVNGDVRAQIQARLMSGLDEAVQGYDEVVFASHSLGAIVAFDVLHDHADRYNKISHWFTLGCPLLKVRRLGQRTDLGKISYVTVKHWFNIYDNTDLVANAIGPAFGVADYLLYDIFVDVGQGLLPSHDYFNNADTLDLIAAAMR